MKPKGVLPQEAPLLFGAPGKGAGLSLTHKHIKPESKEDTRKGSGKDAESIKVCAGTIRSVVLEINSSKTINSITLVVADLIQSDLFCIVPQAMNVTVTQSDQFTRFFQGYCGLNFWFTLGAARIGSFNRFTMRFKLERA